MGSSIGRVLTLALLLVVAPRCVSHDAGIEVAVAFRLTPAPATFETSDGRLLRVERAELSIGEVEWVPCEEHAWVMLGTSRALAHGGAVGGGLQLDLLADGGRTQALPPTPQPPGRYCALRVHLEPREDGDPTWVFEAAEDGAPAVSIADPSAADALIPLDAPVELDQPGLVGVELSFDPWAWPLAELDTEGLARLLERDARASCTTAELCQPPPEGE